MFHQMHDKKPSAPDDVRPTELESMKKLLKEKKGNVVLVIDGHGSDCSRHGSDPKEFMKTWEAAVPKIEIDTIVFASCFSQKQGERAVAGDKGTIPALWKKIQKYGTTAKTVLGGEESIWVHGKGDASTISDLFYQFTPAQEKTWDKKEKKYETGLAALDKKYKGKISMAKEEKYHTKLHKIHDKYEKWKDKFRAGNKNKFVKLQELAGLAIKKPKEKKKKSKPAKPDPSTTEQPIEEQPHPEKLAAFHKEHP